MGPTVLLDVQLHGPAHMLCRGTGRALAGAFPPCHGISAKFPSPSSPIALRARPPPSSLTYSLEFSSSPRVKFQLWVSVPCFKVF